MQITGIICEYNPLHLGHKKQIDYLHEQDHAVVCLMSGNFVQRGHPAIFDKMCRAQAAVACGADLVLELPITYALSSAEGFAAGGVQILSQICDNICFGAENADMDALIGIAKALLSADFSENLHTQLDKGLSFPTARAAAIAACGLDATLLHTPNNILAIEYCKAILSQNSGLTPLPILRPGSYHAETADADNPSATSLRNLIEKGEDWRPFVPLQAQEFFENAATHTLQNGEKAILAQLRTMTDAEFEALPYGTEGLWRKLMHASREYATLEEIITATKSKRYTRTRIDRMILCAFLRIKTEDISAHAPYCRILAFNDKGRQLIKHVKETGYFVNIGERTNCNFETLEQRSGSLYGLFANQSESPVLETQYRVIYQK